MPRPFLILSQWDYLIPIVAISSHTSWQTVYTQIRWLLQEPTDLDRHCLQRQGISGFSRTRVKALVIFLLTVSLVPREGCAFLLLYFLGIFAYILVTFNDVHYHGDLFGYGHVSRVDCVWIKLEPCGLDTLIILMETRQTCEPQRE